MEVAARDRPVDTHQPAETPVLYANDEAFPVGGSKTLRSSPKDAVTVVAAGVTLHEALAAHEALAKDGIAVRVIDLYSVKPIDVATLRKAAAETRGIVTVEDHSVWGGIGDAVASQSGKRRIEMLGVRTVRCGKTRRVEEPRG